ncbi:MAG: hypothetical protein ACYDCI_01955 [Candidatus Limnocylindrales bacterium]
MTDGLDLVVTRPLIVHDPVVRLPFAIGDRALVDIGVAVEQGTALAVRMREVTAGPAGQRRRGRAGRSGSIEDGTARSGTWSGTEDGAAGERLFELAGGWWISRGTPDEELTAPVAGVVRSIRPGRGLEFVASGAAVAGTAATGGPVRGRLEAIDARDGDLRAGAIDVARAGAILIVGGRVDAEAITRARAMGVRGIVVGGMSEKVLHDLAASERRQLASVHRPPPFAVVVLHGPLRRPLDGPVRTILEAAAGREVAIVADPPLLLLGEHGGPLPQLDPHAVWVTQGPLAGRSGRWAGLAGSRRFRAGVQLEAGFVLFPDGSRAAVPLGDLERHA